MKTIKLIILLALLMPVVLNAQTVTVDGIDYYITSDWYYGTQTARVSARAGKNGYSAYKELDNIVIHEQVTYNGVECPVTGIENGAFYYCDNITTLELPSTIVSIGGSAFEHCDNLTSIVLPSGLVEIGENAFRECTSLSSIEIPSGVTEIGAYAFMSCSQLKSVTLHEGLSRICEHAFYTCGQLEDIVLPSSLREIQPFAFQYCFALTHIEIPSGTTTITSNPFVGCTSLTSLSVESGNTVYESPDNRYIIEKATKRLIAVNNEALIPTDVTIIGKYVFSERDDLESIVIPQNVTRIEEGAFWWCKNLKTISIRGTIDYVGYIAFEGTHWYYNQPNGLVYLNDMLLGYKNYPEKAYIKNGTRLIAERCFEMCSADELSIPSTVELIGDYIFSMYGNYSIQKMYVGSSVPIEITENALYLGNSIPLYVPVGCSGNYQSAPYWNGFYAGYFEFGNEEITVGTSGIRTFCSENSLDFYGSDVKAYAVTDYDATTSEIILTRIYDVPERTGVVLVADPGTYQVPSYPRPSDGTNMLVGVTNDTYLNKVYDGYTNYILATKNGNIGFYPVKDGTTLAAGKAYLRLPVGSQPSLARMRFADDDNEATGIVTRMTAPIGDGHIYNLSGQRLREPVKGLNIVNGKKVMVK